LGSKSAGGRCRGRLPRPGGVLDMTQLLMSLFLLRERVLGSNRSACSKAVSMHNNRKIKVRILEKRAKRS